VFRGGYQMKKILLTLMFFALLIPTKVDALSCVDFLTALKNVDREQILVVHAEITEIISDDSMKLTVISNYSNEKINQVLVIKHDEMLKMWDSYYEVGTELIMILDKGKVPYLGLCSSVPVNLEWTESFEGSIFEYLEEYENEVVLNELADYENEIILNEVDDYDITGWSSDYTVVLALGLLSTLIYLLIIIKEKRNH
jgi:hypothetical protein